MSFDIIGTGGAEPEFVLTNQMLEEMVETSDEWITQRTGIRERRIVRSETMQTLARKAGLEAMEDAGIQAEDLDYLLFATIGGDYRTPSQASILSMDLGADCPAMDINAACTGFIYALDVADALFRSGKAEYILVAGMEIMSRFVDFSDRNTCVLFGDGGGAVVLRKGDGLKAIHLTGKGNIDSLNVPSVFPNSPWHTQENQRNTVYMNGQEVYKFAVNAFIKELNTCLDQADLTTDDLSLVIPHQANSRIIESARQKLKMSKESFVNAVDKRGNTSAGSIPLILNELNREGRLKPGMKLGLAAFGGGLTSAAAIIEWTKMSEETK